MKPIPLQFPPGVVHPGAEYDAKGRWHESNLIRWAETTLEAVNGWEHLQDATPANVSAGEPVRGVYSWYNISGVPKLAFGGPTKLYVYVSGARVDITPATLGTGNADSSEATELYGYGSYGGGLYGSGDLTQGAILEAQTWQFANFGEDLLAVPYSDPRIFVWDGGAQLVQDAATPLENAPGADGVVVTPERFVVAIGADNNPRKVAWSDLENATEWTPSATNQAGDETLDDTGELLAGRTLRSETLLWSTAAVHAMRYIGGTFVYTIQKVGTACGAISRQAMTTFENRAYWMGPNGFFMYDGGAVREITSPVRDYVFEDFNLEQKSKVAAVTVRDYDEIWWFYPSSGSTENDRYVKVNTLTGAWDFGELERTSGVDRGVEFQTGSLAGSGKIVNKPIMADADGNLYIHEEGTSYLDPDDNALTPYAESGPFELGTGERLMHVLGMIPAEGASGSVQYRLYSRLYPEGTETEQGPYTSANKMDFRFSARQVRLRVEQVTAGWHHGTPRLLVRPAGRR